MATNKKKEYPGEILDLQYDLGSECCGSPLLVENDGWGICRDCKEHASYISIDELNKDWHMYV